MSLVQYGKQYSSAQEEALRFAIYQSHRRMIEDHNLDYNSGKSSFWMELNRFSDFSVAEYRTMLGLKMKAVPRNLKAGNCTHQNIVAPLAVDWRVAGAVTQVE